MNSPDAINRYGVSRQRGLTDAVDAHVEDIEIKGFTVVEGVLDDGSLAALRNAMDQLLVSQTEQAGGRAALEAIGEADLVRVPLAFNDIFLDVARNARVLEVVKRLLGGYVLLSQQNAIINAPSSHPHHQSAFHRDLPYQHFTASKPLAVNALFCIDPFKPEVGSTVVLPGSHRVEEFPSDAYVSKNAFATTAPAGSVLIMDSMLFHRAGHNGTQRVRRGLNHLYSIPILKQQISLPSLLKGKWSDDPELSRFLGYDSEPAASVEDFRARRRARGNS